MTEAKKQQEQIAALRREYAQRALRETDLADHPITQFAAWFQEALDADAHEPNAMCISTVSRDGQPSNRMVLLKEFDESGFVFYTNYKSRKGLEIDETPRVALLFYWPELERQIRVEGTAHPIPREQSLHYFHSRPRGSQLGAHASDQSQPIESREALEAKHDDAEEQFGEDKIPLPTDWGGYLIQPQRLEFWQGGGNRLHDRLVYTKQDKTWTITRLQP